MSLGLPVSRLINATVSLSPLAAQFANLNSLLIVGESTVIDVASRIRTYASLAAVATDFGTSAAEYLAASLYFAQAPQPTSVMIGRWAHGASAGVLLGAALTPAQQLVSVFQAFTTGQFKIQVDGAGSPVNVTCGTMAGVTNLNGVATIINAALVTATVGATCVWNATYNRFEFTSSTTGATSKVKPLTAGTANDISAALGGTALAGATEVDGIAAETAVAAVAILDALATPWYGLMLAAPDAVSADHLAIAAYIQGSGNPHIYGVTTQDTGVLSPAGTSDIAYLLSQALYTRTFCQFSSSSAYAAASLFGRILTVDYTQNNSTITLMYKQEPGIVPETLTATAANAIDTKRCNVFVNYNNATAIIEDGVMSGPAYIDEITGTDWLANAIQTNVWNVLFTSTTKIPQTDAGNHVLATAIEQECAAGVTNGLLAPGTWNAGGFGQLKQGDLLSKGYYVYCPPIASQATADRAARKSVSFQVAAKLAGAIHSANISISVNR
jgi:hypothetical protein